MADAVTILIVIVLALAWYGALRRLSAFMIPRTKPPAPHRHAGFVPIPCIFANGRDDDTAGLLALFTNRPVIVGNSLYPPNVFVDANFPAVAVQWPGVEFWHDGECLWRSEHTPRFRVDVPTGCRGIKINFEVIQFGFIAHEQDH